ncbi:MAG: hypothetical protein AB1603_06215, partial [Chloroflexota bacterium]
VGTAGMVAGWALSAGLITLPSIVAGPQTSVVAPPLTAGPTTPALPPTVEPTAPASAPSPFPDWLSEYWRAALDVAVWKVLAVPLAVGLGLGLAWWLALGVVPAWLERRRNTGRASPGEQ